MSEITLIENIFLLGSFGVKLPENLSPKNFEAQGLPFYGGKITFLTEQIGNKVFHLEKTDNTASAKILCGKKEEYITTYPYSAYIEGEEEVKLQIVLSRRNTFGPFYKKGTYYCDPNSFEVIEKEKLLLD